MIADHARERFLRQIAIEGFGETGQEKLSRAHVMVAGAGGLGCAVCTYLAAAGIGTLCVVDQGEIELSNLNRQVLYSPEDIGKTKAATLKTRLQGLNPDVRFEPVQAVMDKYSLPGLLHDMNVVVDALDNLPTRYALNKACLDEGIPLVHGGVHGMHGQAMTVIPGEGPCLMCLFGGSERKEMIPVLGTIPGLIGCIQATEVIKILTGLGALLSGRILLFDGLDMRFSELVVHRNPHCPHCGELR
jgi:molybdopterin/thiamine biosynthesis adenylyltransferase